MGVSRQTVIPNVGRSARLRVGVYFHRLANAGGGERMACELADALAAYGNRVFLVSLDTPGIEPFYGVTVSVTRCPLGFRSGLWDKARRFWALVCLFRREKIQVLIGFVMSGDRTVIAAARVAGVRLVAAERNAPSMYRWRHSAYRRWQCMFLLMFVARIVVQFDDFIRGYPRVLHNHMEAIPNPVASAVHRASPEKANSSGRYTVLAVGRLDDIQKRLSCLIDGFAKVAGRHPTWDLEIVGDGPDKDMLLECIARNGLDIRVRLLPTQREVSGAYARSNLFSMASRWEGFPNALAEAMAHGLPAVGFGEAGGVAHLIEDGETGWLARGVDDPGTLAEALDCAMSDATERARRGARAVEAMRVYAPDVQYDKWHSLVEVVAGGSVPEERR